jgi:protein O-GlcNAc transferase
MNETDGIQASAHASTPAGPGDPDAITLPQAVQIALEHHRAGRLPEAEAIYQKVLQADPDYADALHLLGVIAYQAQKFELANALIGRAIVLNPDDAAYHSNLGNVLRETGQPAAAAEQYRLAIALQPAYAEVYNNFGNALQDLAQIDAAIVCYRQAISCQAAYPEAYNNLGQALSCQGHFDEAIAAYRQAIALNPAYPEPHNNLANTYKTTGQVDLAVEHYQAAIALRPTYAEAYNNLGWTLHDMGVLDAAVEHYQQALALKPDFAEAHSNLGNARSHQGDLNAAFAHFKTALSINPDFDLAHSNLLFHLNYHALSSPEDYLQEARRFGRRMTQRARPYTQWLLTTRSPGSALRVGLVSGDLRAHPVGYFLENVLAHLDPRQIEIVAYATKPHRDALTERLQAHCVAWQSLLTLSDEAAARKIHEDGIHILVDLAGHTADNRLPVFAWRPAPVQVAWLGYFASTGVAEIDYILADKQVLPESEAHHFVERPWRLPDCYLCFTPPEEVIEVGALPLQALGHVTFGCFNKLGKMNDTVVALWARVLEAVPASRLLLKAKELNNPAMRAATLARFASQGIAAGRIVLEGHTPRADYLADYRRVDIALDPFPFTGGTTTVEALWMGVPVLSLRGDRFVSHAGESLLQTAGLGDWIALDRDTYIAKALAFSTDCAGLAATRAGLRARLLASPLCDAPRFAAQLTRAFQEMWRAFIAGQEPQI